MFRFLRGRGAFTLVELLVVIAIIGILVALLLPAIQAAREAARRAECSNNLKQLGISLHNYHDTYKRFPINHLEWGSPNGPESRGSHLVRLFPFMEQGPLYESIPFSSSQNPEDATDATGRLIRATIVKPLICPSDTHDGYAGDTNRAVTNYAGSLGAQHMGSNTGCNLCTVVPTPVMPTPGGVPPCESWFTTGDRERADQGDSDRISGVFGRGGGTGTNNPPWAARLANVTDGTANVIAMGEVRPLCGDHSRRGWMHANANWFATTAPINFNTCPGEGGLSVNDGANPACNQLQSWNTSMGFKSAHPGGAQFVFCDGSTHFLPATINYDTYQRLGDRRDANPVSGGF